MSGDPREGRSRIERVFDAVVGNTVSSRVLRSQFQAPLRILAYHEIVDPVGFRLQMEHIVHYYRPVDSEAVVQSLKGRRLPRRAVWITFDDGDPSVVEQGLPILQSLGLTATMFICPWSVGNDRPFWWQVADVVAPDQIPVLKTLPDAERVERVRSMEKAYQDEFGEALTRSQIRNDHLRRWLNAGCDLGNHTWDHPLLDRCEPEEQRRQIVLAHEWMADHVAPQHLLFAYPNGNATPHTRKLLQDLGYSVAALFDHSMARRRDMELSRLRTNADHDVARFRAIVSGAHPALHRLRGET